MSNDTVSGQSIATSLMDFIKTYKDILQCKLVFPIRSDKSFILNFSNICNLIKMFNYRHTTEFFFLNLSARILIQIDIYRTEEKLVLTVGITVDF